MEKQWELDVLDSLFWRVDLPLRLIEHWRAPTHNDDETDRYVDQLAAAWVSGNPPPPIVVVLHPVDSEGHACSGLDGYRRIAAAKRAGLELIPAWAVSTNEEED